MYPAKTARLAAALLAFLLLPDPGMAGSQIWFAPSSPEPGWGGTVDYLDLFSPSAPWPNAASHVQVFKFYTMLIDYFSDDDLRRMFGDLDRRGIALAVEFAPLTVEDCGGGEGFSSTDHSSPPTPMRSTLNTTARTPTGPRRQACSSSLSPPLRLAAW